MQDLDNQSLKRSCHKAMCKFFQTDSHYDQQTYVKLRNHITSTASYILDSTPTLSENLFNLINKFEYNENCFGIRNFSYTNVYNKIQNLRRDCSSGDDNIPIWLLMPVAVVILSSQVHVINVCIEKSCLPRSWKIGQFSPSHNIDIPNSPDDYKPIAIFPTLSKTYEILLYKQIVDYGKRAMIYKNTLPGFQQNHSTIILLLKLKMISSKPLAVVKLLLQLRLTFSKLFDTIDHCTLIEKL